MESILLATLSFRLELPTTHQFVHLYAEGLAQVPPEVLCTALFLTVGTIYATKTTGLLPFVQLDGAYT